MPWKKIQRGKRFVWFGETKYGRRKVLEIVRAIRNEQKPLQQIATDTGVLYNTVFNISRELTRLSGNRPRLIKVPVRRFEELRKTAIAMIEGRAILFEQKPKDSWSGETKHGREKVMQVVNELKITAKTHAEIAREFKVPLSLVGKISGELGQRTGKTRYSKGRNFTLVTGHFSEIEIYELIKKYNLTIKKRAQLLWKNPRVRTLLSAGLPAVMDRIRDDLHWRLQIYSPKKMRIDPYINLCLNWIFNEIIKETKNKKVATLSLTQEPLAKSEKMTKPSVSELLAEFKRKGLTPNERTLLLARYAGINLRKVGEILGSSESAVSYLFKPIRKKMGISSFKKMEIHY